MDDNMNNNNDINNEAATQPPESNENGVNWDSQSNYPNDPFEDTQSQTPKKKSKLKPVLAGVAGVVVVGAVGVGAASAIKQESPVDILKEATVSVAETVTGKSFGTPQERLQKAIDNTKAELENRSMLSSSLVDLTENGKVTANIGASVTSMPYYTDIEGAGIDVTINSDKPNNTANLNLTGSYHGITLDALNLYTDGTEVVAGVPMVTNKYVLSFDVADIEEQIKNSPLLSEYYSDVENQLSDMAAMTEASQKVQSEFENMISDNYAVLCDSVVYEDSEDKGEHDDAIQVTIPADALETFFTDSLNGIADSETLGEYITEMADIEGEDADSAKEELQSSIDEIIEKISFEDATGVFYIDDNIITDSEIEGEVKVDDESGVITLNAGLNDGVFEAEFKLKVDDNFIKVNYSDEDKDGVRTIDASLKTSDSDNAVLDYSCEYDTSSNEISGKIDVAGEASIDYSGTLESSDDAFKLDLSSVKLSSYGTDVCELSFNVGIESYDGEIERPAGESVRIFEITEDDLETIATDLQDDIMSFYNNIVSKLS